MGCPRRILADQGSHRRHILIEESVFFGIGHIHPACQHRYHAAAALQGAPQGQTVNSLGNPGHQQRSTSGQLQPQPGSHLLAVSGGLAAAHHANGRLFVKADAAAQDIQNCRWIAELAQTLGVVGILDGHDLHAQPVTPPQDGLALLHIFVQKASDRLGSKTWNHLQILLLRKVYPLRRAEVLQHPQHASLPHPFPGGQPEPVVQRRHGPSPFSPGDFLYKPIRAVLQYFYKPAGSGPR